MIFSNIYKKKETVDGCKMKKKIKIKKFINNNWWKK